jgi:hypothetical protein
MLSTRILEGEKSLCRMSRYEDDAMNWKEQLDKAIAAIREAAESEKAREIAAKAKEAATTLAREAKEGAVSAADAFVEANRDPSSLEVRFLNANLIVLSPSEGISPSPGPMLQRSWLQTTKKTGWLSMPLPTLPTLSR